MIGLIRTGQQSFHDADFRDPIQQDDPTSRMYWGVLRARGANSHLARLRFPVDPSYISWNEVVLVVLN